jgi:hypothetical protein
MSRVSHWAVVVGLGVFLCGLQSISPAQDAKDFQITASLVGLPDGNVRTAEPYQPRAYPAKDDGKTPDRTKRPSWFGKPEDPKYRLKDGGNRSPEIHETGAAALGPSS